MLHPLELIFRWLTMDTVDIEDIGNIETTAIIEIIGIIDGAEDITITITDIIIDDDRDRIAVRDQCHDLDRGVVRDTDGDQDVIVMIQIAGDRDGIILVHRRGLNHQ